MTDLFTRKTIKRILKLVNNDAIYSHFWDGASLSYQFANINKVPLFVGCGESDDLFELEMKNFSPKTLRDMPAAISGVISVSTENKEKCIKYSLAKVSQIEVFPNCVDTTKFHKTDEKEIRKQLKIKDEDFVITFVGGFRPRKGPDRVAKAITKLKDPQIKVMFIGEPLVGHSYNFNCPGIIHKGSLPHDLLPKYLNCSDAFILPTQSEGCSNAIVEALAVGLPVISSKGAFNDDILDENNSIRINPTDIDEIADAINKLKNDNELRRKMSSYSESKHIDYSIEKRAEKILDFIQRKTNI